ncbi:L,D-transpeptidase family protein [Streptomyces broussonetiae]|uniref:L,D-transpeptidase family protein n=1 Tax=Streptomyces broussonetiae TaxID=2686304 RepID=A0A6I6NAH1_9ACTN|nr:Ig-like domain-containing protein [Streptomyces broussonetiae]QHA06940.1 L,D-transpeptidase family protein [Streptomyces broussonetiae]
MRHVQGRARRAGAALAAVLTGAALLAGCTKDPFGPGGTFGDPPAPGDVIHISPDDGGKDVRPDQRLRIEVPDGRLEKVLVVKSQDAQDSAVPGRISTDGQTWQPDDDRLALAAKYTVDVVADDADGRRTARHTTFTTLVPDRRFIAYVTPENRATVGTGVIVSLSFSGEVADRAAVERAVRVSAQPPVEIRPHWFGRSRLDFRPEQYWKPGTEVTVDLNLRDVQGAPGVYGLQDKTFAFTVGRSQVSVVDARRHTMSVRRDGQLLATVPITAGAPQHPTYNGRMVVMDMQDITRMNSHTVGFGGEYDIPDVPHAMKLTNSGTYVHGNYWSPDAPGHVNVSHGCVGLMDVKGGSSDTPAGWFFDRSLVGDVVEVVGSNDRTVAADNGLGGWNMTWKEWKAGSAVK